jgi:hypothetical protein
MTQCVKSLLTATLAVAVGSSARGDEYRDLVRSAVERLADDSYRTREKAMNELRDLGPAAAFELTLEDLEGDPERAGRLRELMEEWEYSPVTAGPDLTERRRLLPWDHPSRFDAASLEMIEDSRVVADAVRRLSDPADRGRVRLRFLKRPEILFSDDELSAALRSERAGEAIEALLDRPGWVPNEVVRAAILRKCREFAKDWPNFESATWALARFAPEDPATWDSLKPGRLQGVPVIPRGIVGVDDALDSTLLEHFRRHLPAEAARRYRRKEFLETYLAHGNWAAILDLPVEHGDRSLLPLMLCSEKPEVRASLAVRLQAASVPAGWIDFESIASWEGEHLLQAAPRLRQALLDAGRRTGREGIEARLREAIQGAERSAPLARSLLLRVLCDRGRESDVTFVWTRLEVLPATLQPEVAVSLSRLGSAAGVGLMLPHLDAFEWDLRRDAGEALKRITGQDFGYDPLASLRDRCIAALRWKIWWKENRTSFSPDRAKIR